MLQLRENLVYLRSINGYTQEQLSRMINRQKSLIGFWETGKTQPQTHDLLMLSKLYNTSINSLVRESLSKPVINRNFNIHSQN